MLLPLPLPELGPLAELSAPSAFHQGMPAPAAAEAAAVAAAAAADAC